METRSVSSNHWDSRQWHLWRSTKKPPRRHLQTRRVEKRKKCM